MSQNFNPEPFTIAVADGVLADLHRRLDHVRWPNEPRAVPWTYGADGGFMKTVVQHWRARYDWRVWEARLNAVPNYRARIGDYRIHFMLEKGSGPAPLPLLLTHGWPGSVMEFLEVIDPLAHPERHGGDVRDAFTVVVPSLPGFGFSDPPPAPIEARDIAGLWSRLMTEVLGCSRYVAQGGDWGATVTSWLGLDFPDKLAALHLNSASFRARPDPEDPFTPDEIAWHEADAARRAGMMGYVQIQGTRPQTLAYGLTDSPIGLAAWILEKFHDWTVRGDPGPPPFPLDHLLTNVMLYWLNGINAANWMYVHLLKEGPRTPPPGRRIEVPTGFMLCPADIGVPPPDRWLRRSYNLVHRNDAAQGGHFLAFEQGPLFVEEVRRFFRRFR